MSDKKSNVKKRNWAFIAYPDSAPENWLDILRQKGFMFSISPKHDRDTDPDEKEKKPHWHVIVCYSGPTSYNVVKAITEEVNSSIPVPLEQVRGYYRYFTHKDNPEKFQYDEKDIQTFNGFNIADFFELTKSEVNAIVRSLQSLIRDQQIAEYSIFMDYLLDNEMLTEHDVASSHTYFFDKYITSIRHRLEKRQAAQEQLRRPEAQQSPEVTTHLVTCDDCGETKPDSQFSTYQGTKGVCFVCCNTRDMKLKT